MIVRQRLPRHDDLVQVGLHQVKHDVDIAADDAAAGGGVLEEYVDDADDVGVPEMAEDPDLAQRADERHLVAEWVPDLLDRVVAVAMQALGVTHDAVGPGTCNVGDVTLGWRRRERPLPIFWTNSYRVLDRSNFTSEICRWKSAKL